MTARTGAFGRHLQRISFDGAPDGKAKPTRTDFKIKLLKREIRIEPAIGVEADILNHPHRVDPHLSGLGQAVTGHIFIKAAVGETDFTFILENVHPAIAFSDGIDRFQGQRARTE